MTVVRKDPPWRFPIRYSDGEFTDKCKFGVKVGIELEPEIPTCPVCGENCTCGCVEQQMIAGVSSPTCLACHWNVGTYEGDVVCSHPVTLTGE